MPSIADMTARLPLVTWQIRLGLAVAAVILVADQASKWVILEYVMQPPRLIEVTGFFNLAMVWNTGVSFGLFGEGGDAQRWALVAVALAITGVVAYLMWQADRKYLVLAFGMVIGGAIGNVIDRIRLGAVADFLDVHLCSTGAGEFLVANLSTCHWPAFNIADSAIVIAVGMLLFDSLFGPKETEQSVAHDDKERTET